MQPQCTHFSITVFDKEIVFMGPIKSESSDRKITTNAAETDSTASSKMPATVQAVTKTTQEVFVQCNPTFTQYHQHFKVETLSSTLEIKQRWLHSEWEEKCQFSRFVRPYFPKREALLPSFINANVKLIEEVFNNVRGKYLLWQSPKEQGRWSKITVTLKLDWVQKYIHVGYPSSDRFDVKMLNGIVIWKGVDFSKNGKYELLEGNHRISTWLAAKEPPSLPAIIFIGEPKA